MKEARKQKCILYSFIDRKVFFLREINGDRSLVVTWEQGEVPGEAVGGYRRVQEDEEITKKHEESKNRVQGLACVT